MKVKSKRFMGWVAMVFFILSLTAASQQLTGRPLFHQGWFVSGLVRVAAVGASLIADVLEHDSPRQSRVCILR